MVRGGPPRHVHYEQEEWFFFLEGGEVIMGHLELPLGGQLIVGQNVRLRKAGPPRIKFND
jgi:hypothetical protein